MLSPFGSGRVGVAEEQEVRDVDVELGNEWRDEVVVLPHCVGAEAMDEEEIGLVGFRVFGDPEVDDGGAVVEGDGG